MMERHEHVDCREVLDRLWAYLDGEMTPEGDARMREHLDACAQCCPCHDFHRAFLEFLSTQAQQPVPSRLRRRVFERLLSEERAAG